MTDPTNGTTDPLERNVEKLLSRAEPEVAMPADARRRTLRALLEDATRAPSARSEGRSTRPAPRRRWSWLAAAAAVIAIATVLFWPGSLENGVAWADVVRHLESVETLVARITAESVSPTGERVLTRAMLYQKDPGLSRSETYPPPPSGSDPAGDWTPDPEAATSVTILSRGEDDATVLHLFPAERLAYRTHLELSGEDAEARKALPRDMASDAWERLTGLAPRRTRRIGEREIDGVRAVGFEAAIRDVFGDPRWSKTDGVLRVWADAGTGVPVEVEAEFEDGRGGRHHTWFRALEWDVPLGDEAFRVPDDGSWRVVEVRMGNVEFEARSFREGVTLAVGPPGGPAIFTERDVEAVVSGRTFLDPGEARPRTAVSLQATPEGERKVRAYTGEHIGEWLEVDFNGEARYRLRIGGVIGKRLLIDVTPLGLTAEEFEAAYLAR